MDICVWLNVSVQSQSAQSSQFVLAFAASYNEHSLNHYASVPVGVKSSKNSQYFVTHVTLAKMDYIKDQEQTHTNNTTKRETHFKLTISGKSISCSFVLVHMV